MRDAWFLSSSIVREGRETGRPFRWMHVKGHGSLGRLATPNAERGSCIKNMLVERLPCHQQPHTIDLFPTRLVRFVKATFVSGLQFACATRL
jgi:hypothetical protein